MVTLDNHQNQIPIIFPKKEYVDGVVKRLLRMALTTHERHGMNRVPLNT
jgi:hypothetical protein